MIRFIIDKIKLTSPLTMQISSRLAPTKKFSTLIHSKPENLNKDVVVYNYENGKLFKVLNMFSISQLFFWGYIGNWAYVGMKDAKPTYVDEDTAWYRKINLGEPKYKNTIAAGCFLLGYLSITLGWLFTLRSVRYLILKKDGKTVSFVCYTPFGGNRIMDVPIRCISAQESRNSARTYLPLKVQNTRLYYILDMKGEFRNKKLFDNVIALKRNFR